MTVGEQWKTFWHCVVLLRELQSHSSDCDWPGLKEIDLAAWAWIWSASLISLVWRERQWELARERNNSGLLDMLLSDLMLAAVIVISQLLHSDSSTVGQLQTLSSLIKIHILTSWHRTWWCISAVYSHWFFLNCKIVLVNILAFLGLLSPQLNYLFEQISPLDTQKAQNVISPTKPD